MADKRVLVAEDDPDLRRLLRTMLKAWDFEPVLVDDGAAALEILCGPNPPPRAILDWMMPRTEGIEVVRGVRAAGLDTQILLLTARDTPEDVVAALEAGADDYVTKPFDFSELHARLRRGPRRAAAPRGDVIPAAEFAPGAVLGQRWRLEERIAEGGMGDVWRARHVELGHLVAVKTIRDGRGTSAILRARFEAEAMAASRLRSPYVAQVFDYGTAFGGAPFLVMELLDGMSLHSRVVSGGPMPLADVAELVRQAALALQHAHESGLVHRDVKPQNVFVDGEKGGDDGAPAMRVKLIDFGIARLLERRGPRITADGAFVGTPGYSSPEQFLGHDVGPASDLWSLGAVVFFAATGAPPLREANDAAYAAATIDEPFPVPSIVRPDLPPAFDRWVARACARHAADRFESPAEMSRALRALVLDDPSAEHPIAARPIAPILASPDAASTVTSALYTPRQVAGRRPSD